MVLASVFSSASAPAAAFAEPPQHCVPAEIVLWGDGRHDDTAALNAWWRGVPAIWGATGGAVGAAIAGRRFRLEGEVIVPGGTRRRLENFRMLWPERGETVAGGMIVSGDDPDQAPVVAGVTITGGDADEGVPFEAADPASRPDNAGSCATS